MLVDNNTIIDQYFIGEPGLSLYIKEGDMNILFDVGYSGLFLQNAASMKIDLSKLDFLVLSHGHDDHTGGLKSLIQFFSGKKSSNEFEEPTVVAHPWALWQKQLDNCDIGSSVTAEILASNFPIMFTKEPLWLTEKLVFLGEIPRRFSFEGQKPIGKVFTKNGAVDDYLLDDSALAYKSNLGLIIITGCSHAGICNIIEYAKEVTGIEKVVDIVGGMHLLSPSAEKMKNTIDYLRTLHLNKIHPCHCTDFYSKTQLAGVAKIYEVGVGLKINYF